MLRAIALTLFPEMFPGPLGHSLAGKALEKGLWSLQTINIRDFAQDRHKTVDDAPYGGGTGMLMRPDVLGLAIEHSQSLLPNAQLILFTPRGERLTQKHVEALKSKDLILICGRFEGIDERIFQHYQPLEISLGDFVLSGGEIPALALLDACVRLLPGVIGKESALAEESFAHLPLQEGVNKSSEYAGLLEYPQYTRPPSWKGLDVPPVLISGNHAQVQAWRDAQARATTQARRPDLWEAYAKGKGTAEVP